MKKDGLNTNRQMKNPIEECNITSRFFFSWLLPYFVKGYQRELTEDDMYQHRKCHDSGNLGEKLESAWNHQVIHKKNPSFFGALCTTFLPEIMLLWGVNFMIEIARVAQTLLIAKLLNFYDDNSVEENRSDTFLYAGMIVSTSLLYVLVEHSYLFQIMQVEIKMRVAVCSMVYRKSLRLNKGALMKTTIGQMVNLISNDVSRFDRVLHMTQMLILGPLETVVIMVLCYNTIGYTGLMGAIFLLISVPFQSWFGKLTSQYRLRTAIQTDERVRLINEIISGIQVIKMYAWEKPFSKMVELARRKEMVFIRNISIIRALLKSSGPILSFLGEFLCILVYVSTGNILNASYVYTMTSFYKLLKEITMFLPLGVSVSSEMLISIRRIETFLMYDEVDSATSDLKEAEQVPIISILQMQKNKIEMRVHVNRASFKWLDSSPDNTLEDVTIKATTSELVAIVGTVGSGKTTLLNMILGELTPHSGTVMVNGTVSYASQEPWLFGDSIRQNILFGQAFIQKKYDEVVHVCALEKDFIFFNHGDETLVGEKGVKLSGGQRARISLARSIYRNADIYLLDDPLSAVDTQVGKHIFEKCISNYLRDKCVILVTHQLQYMKNISNIYLLEYGKVQVSGSYEIIRNATTTFLTKMDVPDKSEMKETFIITREKYNDFDGNKNGNKNEKQVSHREEKGTGNISRHVYKSYMKAGGSRWKIFFLALTFLLIQILDSCSGYFVSLWVNTCQWLERKNQLHFHPKQLMEASLNLSITVSSINSDNPWWMTYIFTGDETIIYYSSLIVVIIIMILVRNLAFFKWCLTASSNMHYRMFDKIVHSPMRFFHINPCGRILNRFSKDTGALDESIPTTLLDTIQIGFSVIATTVVIGSLSPWILFPTSVIFALFYWIRIVFLRTSRDVARVQSVTRSPIYTHLTTTLQGITTIRAYKVQEILMKEFDDYQNLNSAAAFMYLSITRTLGFWLDLISVFYFALVVFAMLFIKSETFGGNIGLALTQAMGMTGIFQYGVRQWCEMENYMTSVERMQEYVDLVPEKDSEVEKVSQSWPEKGDVEFKNLFLWYAPDDPFVLRNVSFTIRDGEKIGIVGRTGAGKSSLVHALFRLANFKGSIHIDDVDTKTVLLEKLRSKISIIPQEPVLFSGTLRQNLDPFKEFDDEEIWNALNNVELGTAVADLRSGLDIKVADGGSNFSVGQRQLLCLARTILRKNRILVLDEATANIDPHTDELIQKTIRIKFAACTVITIAHRLHTIMDSDRVLVMDSGQVAEFDHPYLLLQNAEGLFYSLVMQTGAVTARTLLTIAEVNYKRKSPDCRTTLIVQERLLEMKKGGINNKWQMTNPIDECNIISRFFFSWLFPYFVKGYQRELTEDDMYQHRKCHDSGKLGRELEAAWHYQVTHRKNPSFFRALCSTFLPEIILLWSVNFMAEIPRVAQPLLIAKLLSIYDDNGVEKNKSDTFLYAGLIVSTSLIYVLIEHSYLLQIMQVEIKIRVAACSLIYKKSLKLNKNALVETTIGQMVNLISNDVSRFDRVLHMTQMLILGPLETVVIMVLCYMTVGYTGLIGAIFLLISIPFQSWFGKLTSKYRLKTAIQTDERVRLINEIISGIQVIKMYAWEKPFSKIVELSRRKELVFVRNTSIIRALLISSGPILNYLGVFLCILVYISTGNLLNASYVYTMTSFYKLLNNMTMYIPLGVSLASEMLISIGRIEIFLMYDEVDSSKIDIDESEKVPIISSQMQRSKREVGVHVNKAFFKWFNSSDNTLEDVTIKVTTGELVAVAGAVGSGKTTLLNMMLGELNPHLGTVMLNGTVSYASQEPWLFDDSIRQNILFGQAFNQKKYNEVVHVCALEKDFMLLTHRDGTLVGERGVQLSGRQRARISLARSIYRDADIYLLDDPLSAVDTHVGKHIFAECISKYLKDECVILVTHQLQYLKNISNIYLLDNGRIQVSGSYEIIRNSNITFLKMMSAEDEIETTKPSILTQEQYNDGNQIEKQVSIKEVKCKGNISGHVYKSYIKAGGSNWKIFFLALAFLSTQILGSCSDYFVTLWVNTCQWLGRKNQLYLHAKQVVESSQNLSTTVPFIDYNSDDPWWVTYFFTGDDTIIYYSSLTVVIIIMILVRNLALFKWCLTVSANKHYRMFDTIVHSPMRFFYINPSGRILNRFSKDTGALDESIPTTLADSIGIGFSVVATTVVIGSLSPWVLPPTAVIFLLFYWIRVVFLRTSRDVARIQSVTRSPIYTHLTTSLQGITTIRAYRVQEMLMKKFDDYQNVNSAAAVMYLSISRTLGFWLDLLSVFYFALVVVAMLFIKSETFGGNIGLALTQAMGLTGIFQYGVRQWCEMENQMTSVERIQEYIDLIPEKDDNVTEVSESWPEKGNVELKNVSLWYALGDPFVLRNVSFTIRDKEKIGIVGRTGAGKSSLVQALFRLADFEGSILIDDVDTKTIHLKKLRSKISIIPQEPVLFSGTLRENLDPLKVFNDEEIWNVLNNVELGTAIADLRSGLDVRVDDGGSNFSVGQRQLLCLARTILRKNKMLVLDEATANIDSHTDGLIQKTIRKMFATCTVITIAHRLHTIMDSDRVLVMDSGQVAEFDHPYHLLQNADGHFYSLVMQTGAGTARNLLTIAEENYKQKSSDYRTPLVE